MHKHSKTDVVRKEHFNIKTQYVPKPYFHSAAI